MKPNIKSLKSLLLSAALATGAIGMTGCNSPGGPVLTRTLTAGIVTGGVSLAVAKEPTVKPYLQAAAPVICSLGNGTNIAPSAVMAALESSSAAALKTTEATIVINQVLSLYVSTYDLYGQNVKNAPYLQAILQGTCDGLETGTGAAAGSMVNLRCHIR